MANGFYDGNNTFFPPSDFQDWSGDTTGFDSSAYMFDSPQPENETLSTSLNDVLGGQDPSGAQRLAAPTGLSHEKRQSHIAVPQDTTSQPSSASGASSHSSSSPLATKHQPMSASPPSALLEGNQAATRNPQMTGIKTEGGIAGPGRGNVMMGTEDALYQGMDTNMNTEMHNLTLQSGSPLEFSTGATASTLTSDMFRDGREDFAGVDLGPIKARNTLESPTTVQPNKTFFLSGSREDSPNEPFANDKDSPSMALSHNSPLTGHPAALGMMLPNESDSKTGMGPYTNIGPSAMSSTMSSPSARNPHVDKRWPCRLKIDPIPDKSRVETQIPIRMTLCNPPHGMKRIHLPSHTISKPKFQQKPPFEKSPDTLELSVLLVCASAMREKERALDRAFQRAECDEIPIKKEDSAGSHGQQDDNDPDKPLNGGPVAICAGCIVRERKRAARKKTKKPEEEEEWLKDEAKRVIVFNCAEVKDWCMPEGNKETPVKEHPGPLNAMSVSVPMRIACYCRHQQEKLGFQVIFTLRNSSGDVVSQAMSDSIMITDDHKQPIPQPNGPPGMTYAPSGQVDAVPMFYPGQQQYAAIGELPIRPSMSTPDLRSMEHQYLPHFGGIQRQFSSHNIATQPSTAAATPRNLSRPASPTNPVGQPGAKKRRSGGSTNKIPSGLHMTSIEPRRSPHANTPSGNVTSAPTSSGFNFASPTSTSFGATPLDQSMAQTSLRTPTNFNSNPSTPFGPSPGGFPNEMDPSQFYSAPTSQHASRAPSPSGSRVHYSNRSSTFPSPDAQSQVVDALSALPTGMSSNQPPMVQRVVPAAGSCLGGDEVSVLGQNFCHGLEVMFGDQLATNTTLWGDTTILCRTPKSNVRGQVQVCFRHQHKSSPLHERQVPGVMPTRPVTYAYLDDVDTDGSMPNMAAMSVLSGMQGYHNHVTAGLGTPPGAGTVSSPAVPGVMDDMGINNMNPAAMNHRALMAFGGQQVPPGSGSAGFNAANFARSQLAQQEAVVAAGRARMGQQRTMSGGVGLGR